MLIPGRHEASGSYRYGFQGQEKDDEIKGEGNSLNYTFRMHDPRLGRFFAVDPLTAQYPWYTPYSFSGNKVIAYGELEGQEEIIRIVYMNGSKTEIKVSDFKGVQSFNNLRVNTFHSIPNWEILQHQKSRTDFIGWDDYTRSGAGNGQMVDALGNWMGPINGTLTIYLGDEATPNIYVYDSKNQNLDAKAYTLRESFNTIAPKVRNLARETSNVSDNVGLMAISATVITQGTSAEITLPIAAAAAETIGNIADFTSLIMSFSLGEKDEVINDVKSLAIPFGLGKVNKKIQKEMGKIHPKWTGKEVDVMNSLFKTIEIFLKDIKIPIHNPEPLPKDNIENKE